MCYASSDEHYGDVGGGVTAQGMGSGGMATVSGVEVVVVTATRLTFDWGYSISADNLAMYWTPDCSTFLGFGTVGAAGIGDFHPFGDPNAASPTGHKVSIRYYYTDAYGLGHLAVSVDGGPFEGKYPTESMPEENLINVPGTVRSATSADGNYATYTMSVTAAQAASMSDYINTAMNTDQIYDTFSNNCTQFVESALDSAGVDTMSTDIMPAFGFSSIMAWTSGSAMSLSTGGP